ncbi:MAG: DUF4388 domain-containing protein [Deltaproteobacteria bacterium]|jgi:hypothetical protein|nr:DUF4388 domain-containing protein [Deltaproteobacteria bacterium]MBW1874126.1 DUF4388 domain-containing protein [Deltaproteobacteria bacterium]MBW2209698.1 DUF4388 domain-containing protein [Deltaproteobacteria bacterium]MBW2212874.1 DUF4388 domain-containing protein [Deltaproteobacteria bacterium]MBW2378260.1 DUF4388 domain-containing protein [Deltaproteobacteria bacterium]
MVAEAVFEGTIPAEGVEDLLGGLEELGTTGVLAFQSTSGSGAIRLVHGQVADAATTADEERALEVLLSLRDGEFAVYPKLPHLPVSRGTDTTRRGSLAVHPPADLMRYCENAGLTGRLLLELRGRLAIGYYEKGELSDVSIDGGTAADFVTALEWTEGTFRVDAVPPPRETLPPSLRDKTSQAPPKNPTALPLLQAFEEGLADLGRTDATPVSGLRPRMEEGDDDATIRIIRRPGDDDLPERPGSWDALDYSPSFPQESATSSPVKSKDDGRQIGFLRTLGWVSAVFVVVAGCLWLLAWLPPLE